MEHLNKLNQKEMMHEEPTSSDFDKASPIQLPDVPQKLVELPMQSCRLRSSVSVSSRLSSSVTVVQLSFMVKVGE